MQSTQLVDSIRTQLSRDHEQTPYYAAAEAADMIDIFWSESGVFRPLFDRLDLTAVTEIACGHGRHTARITDQATLMTLVDVVSANLDACKQRFAGNERVSYVLTTGNELAGVEAGSQTAVFSYDAMVHFELMDVLAYVSEIARVLRPGGRALLHYSANDANPAASYLDCPRWRNFGSESMMLHVAHRSGLTVLHSSRTSWPPRSGEAAIDGVVLLEKPRHQTS